VADDARYDASALENPVSPTAADRPSDREATANLLTLSAKSPKAAADRMIREWEDSSRHWRVLFAQWKVNRARWAGYTGVRLVKYQDDARAFFPRGSMPGAATTNKAVRLCRRVRSVMFNDPPVPEVLPTSDDERDIDAAQTSTRILHDVCGNHELAYTLTAGDAWDLASTHGSGFLRFWVDLMGGGQDAEGQWRPRVRRELLTGRNVRLIPFTAEDIWEAHGCYVGLLLPLGYLKGPFGPAIDKMTPEQVQQMLAYRPARVADILPPGQRDIKTAANPDENLVFVLTRYEVQSADYPEGAYLVLAGGEFFLSREPWVDKTNKTKLDLPLTQFKQHPEADNPYGSGLMTTLGPLNEARVEYENAMGQHLDRFTSRKTFVPLHSNLQPEQLQAETRTYLPIVPNGAPVNEELPDFPRALMESYSIISREMDDDSGLQEAGQGLQQPSVQSGKHAEQIVSQVNAGMSAFAQSTTRGLERGWMVILQQIRAFVDAPLLVRWQDEDGTFKIKRWLAADLSASTDVRIQRGSFTQMSVMDKAEVVSAYAQQQLIAPGDAQRLIAARLGPLVGLQDNPHRLRVRRQLAIWLDGPPPDWAPPPPAVDPATGQVVPTPDPATAAIFDERPVDQQPDVAMVRTDELGRTLSGARYEEMPPEWQEALALAYEAARIAAGIQTVAEQQQAAQAQQQAQEQAVAQQQQQAEAQAETERTAKAQEMEASQALEQQKLDVERQKVGTDLEGQLQGVVQQVQELVTSQTHQHQQDIAKVQSGFEVLKAQSQAKIEQAKREMLEREAPAPPAPTTITVQPPQQTTDALQALLEAQTALSEAVAQLTDERPEAVKIQTDKSGKITGATFVRPSEQRKE